MRGRTAGTQGNSDLSQALKNLWNVTEHQDQVSCVEEEGCSDF